MEINEFFSVDYISTFMGTVVVTMLMVQFLKELPGIKKIPTRYFAFIIAFLNILICSILTNTFNFNNLYLMFINAMLITFTTTGGYDFSINTIKYENNIK
ncbi:hypothetical protein [Clostridium rectalis]|uniref:hypothetical protein n=1 Tax=Clostridium rectalis TaxID=2040295 RepID=UPI000F64255D|nr:hypothetical protein [Clostridium rectalis]